MGWTKREFVTAGFEEIGLAEYVFDVSPEAYQSALVKLDSMMASWNALGIRLGYPIPSTPGNSSLDEQTGVPDSANEAIFLNLAIRLAPSFGKTVQMETRDSARRAYDTLVSRAAMPPEMQLPGTMPAGAGAKPWRGVVDPFLTPPVDPITVGPDSTLDFN